MALSRAWAALGGAWRARGRRLSSRCSQPNPSAPQCSARYSRCATSRRSSYHYRRGCDSAARLSLLRWSRGDGGAQHRQRPPRTHPIVPNHAPSHRQALFHIKSISGPLAPPLAYRGSSTRCPLVQRSGPLACAGTPVPRKAAVPTCNFGSCSSCVSAAVAVGMPGGEGEGGRRARPRRPTARGGARLRGGRRSGPRSSDERGRAAAEARTSDGAEAALAGLEPVLADELRRARAAAAGAAAGDARPPHWKLAVQVESDCRALLEADGRAVAALTLPPLSRFAQLIGAAPRSVRERLSLPSRRVARVLCCALLQRARWRSASGCTSP